MNILSSWWVQGLQWPVCPACVPTTSALRSLSTTPPVGRRHTCRTCAGNQIIAPAESLLGLWVPCRTHIKERGGKAVGFSTDHGARCTGPAQAQFSMKKCPETKAKQRRGRLSLGRYLHSPDCDGGRAARPLALCTSTKEELPSQSRHTEAREVLRGACCSMRGIGPTMAVHEKTTTSKKRYSRGYLSASSRTTYVCMRLAAIRKKQRKCYNENVRKEIQ